MRDSVFVLGLEKTTSGEGKSVPLHPEEDFVERKKRVLLSSLGKTAWRGRSFLGKTFHGEGGIKLKSDRGTSLSLRRA